MRRRRVLAIGGAAVGLSGCMGGGVEAPTSTPARTVDETPTATRRARPPEETTDIGGSVHGRPWRLGDDVDLVGRSETPWIHAFLDVRKKLDGDVPPEEDPDVVALRRVARETEAKLFVSLQWNFVGIFGEQETKSVPPSGSARERALLEFAVELLHAIGEPLDIVALGNEPIWETPNEQVKGMGSPLIPFTAKVKEYVVDNYTAGDPTYLLGAFNRLYSDHVWKEHRHVYRRLLDMARTDDDIDGIDLHVHYDGFAQAERMLEAAREVYPDGVLTATEFSPVWRYDDFKWAPLRTFEGGEAFAERHGVSGDTTVTEYLEAAKDDRLSPGEMADFYETMPWYNVNFVEDMHRLLSRYDVEVGTFGFLVEDDVQQLDWTEGWAPFPINCLFQPALIATDDGAHPHYLEDFKRLA